MRKTLAQEIVLATPPPYWSEGRRDGCDRRRAEQALELFDELHEDSTWTQVITAYAMAVAASRPSNLRMNLLALAGMTAGWIRDLDERSEKAA